MRLLCPITYDIRGSTEKNARISRYSFRERFEVDIEEVSASDAPVAVVWTPNPASEWNPASASHRGISGPDGKQFTRWHEGAHWMRLCDGHFYGRRKLGATISIEHLQSMLESPNQDSAARAGIGLDIVTATNGKVKAKETDGDPRSKFEDIVTDGREFVKSALNSAAIDLISVDGVLHRRCFEPFISVELAVEGGNLVVREVAIETCEDAGAALRMHTAATILAFFGVNQWDRAMRFTETLAASEKGSPIIHDEASIVIDQSLTYDWEVSFAAAKEARTMQEVLSMFSRVREPALERVIAARTAEEQYAIASAIDTGDPRWASNGAAMRSHAKLMDILENRPISIIGSDELLRP